MSPEVLDEVVGMSGGVLVSKGQHLTVPKWTNQTQLTDRINSYVMCKYVRCVD